MHVESALVGVEQFGEMWALLLCNTSHSRSYSHSTRVSFEISQFKVIYICEKPLFRLTVLYIMFIDYVY